ncbi:MAG: radical SAM protein, partial [Gammaproteobacteria bacterium]
LRWSCYATPLKLDRQQARLMARAGCEGLELGTDAVDDGQLKRLGKSFDADAVHAANRHCLEAGLRVCHTVIFGAPGETEDSIRTTCRALRDMQATAVVAMTGVRVYPGTPLAVQLSMQGRVDPDAIGLKPAFYVEPGVSGFLPDYLQQQARAAGNWVLPGMEPPLLPSSQRLLRALGVSGPLWRLLRFRWMRGISRGKFHRPATSWGIPNQRRNLV